MMAAYLLALLVMVGKVPSEVAWPWATAIAGVCDTPTRCVLFTSQAIAEGGFREAVLDGRCNDLEWRRRQRGSWWASACDYGHAAGPWQCHPKDSGGTPYDLRTPGTGTRLAWAYWRRAPGAWTTRERARVIAEVWTRAHPLALP